MKKWYSLLVVALVASLCVVLDGASPAHAAVRPIRFPVLGGASYVDTFGAPRSGGRTHQGQDLFAPKMRTLVAAVDGTVVRMSTASTGLSGNYVVIEDAEGWEYLYIHVNNDTPGTDDGANRRLEAFLPGIYIGAKVYAGQPIGYVGDSGNAEGTPPHLHFEIRDPGGTPINAYGSLVSASHQPIDPAVYLAGMPAGAWDAKHVAPGGYVVSGWAHDPDEGAGKTTEIEVYDNGHLVAVIPTGVSRPDVAAVRGPGAANAGFSSGVGAGPGNHTVCLWARNVGRGPASYLGCATQPLESLPLGNLDAVTVDALSGKAAASGWALDHQTDAPSEIHVYVNGSLAGWGYAARPRADLLRLFPYHSPSHGFSVSVPVPVGTSSVCAYAVDDARPDLARGLGCRSVSRSSTPFGGFDAAVRLPGGVQLQGWAIDPGTADPIAIHAYSGGRLVGYGWADRSRPDVGAAYPAYGSRHGFVLNASLPPGRHVVCVYAIDPHGGANPSLGCRSIDVVSAPIGNLDAVVRSGSTVSAQGWALDPDVAGAIEVHVLVDGALAGWGYADRVRPDVGAAYPLYGAAHGFAVAATVAPGTHDVCVYAIDVGGGGNRLLGCRRT